MALDAYVFAKAARGLEEISKGRVKQKRSARDAEHASRTAQTAANRASQARVAELDRIMASPEPLKLNPNPPKKTKVVVESPRTVSAPAKSGRLASTGRSIASYAARHPYRIGGAAAGAAMLAGGGTLVATRRQG